MKITKARFIALLIVLAIFGSLLQARTVAGESPDKKLDLANWHNVGNIWLRVSNYGFFGAGSGNSPRWPSLEYPGGSGIDYLYQGALWFGAKKQRRDGFGRKLYWNADYSETIAFGDTLNGYDTLMVDFPVIDTLVSVGFDGDLDNKEFLPAYNPLETAVLGAQYTSTNSKDITATASIRKQRRGVDDDGDGFIDEDPVGYAFPFRNGNELPEAFEDFGELFPSDFDEVENFDGIITDYSYLWFPLGFVDLSEDPTDGVYNTSEPYNDDMDSLVDEDGFPVSEQDFISYYYDYSPFGTPGDRDWGGSMERTDHWPLNVKVRQLSYQWSYEHIKNLVYVEFNITNMNPLDTLYDCAMGIYMDSDVGPQAWSSIAEDDQSGFVAGEGFNFAYTYDANGDGGLTTGLVGSRVCTPDPDELEFACWYWDVGDGPEDSEPDSDIPGNGNYENQKYKLLVNINPDATKYTSLLTGTTSPIQDTRYLFGFYGAQEHTGDTDNNDIADYLEVDSLGTYFKRWNLAPSKTMKIVLAVFPGDNISHLKVQSTWAKKIYGDAQSLAEVVLPDLNLHYDGPEPPAIPNLYAVNEDDGNRIDVYWDNRSEIENEDFTFVDEANVGWQDTNPALDSHIDNYQAQLAEYGFFPTKFAPFDEAGDATNRNDLGQLNPWTAYRLRHDFQGYTLWGRSGSGSQENWMHMEKWDRVEHEQQTANDFYVNAGEAEFLDYGGIDLGIEKGMPDDRFATADDIDYYRLNEFYELVNIVEGDMLYGESIYDAAKVIDAAITAEIKDWTPTDQALYFKNPNIPEEIYLNVYDDSNIPVQGHTGASNYVVETGTEKEESRKNRLSRRYYTSSIRNPGKGIEYYVAVTAWDRGMPYIPLNSLESGRDEDANMKVLFPGSNAKSNMNNIYVVPNPYVAQSNFDGKRENDEKGDKSRRIWFVNLPEKCNIKIFTLAGDLVDTVKHNGAELEDVITVSKASYHGLKASGMASWDLLSRNNQIIAPGVYLYSVKSDGDIKVGKFVVIK